MQVPGEVLVPVPLERLHGALQDGLDAPLRHRRDRHRRLGQDDPFFEHHGAEPVREPDGVRRQPSGRPACQRRNSKQLNHSTGAPGRTGGPPPTCPPSLPRPRTPRRITNRPRQRRLSSRRYHRPYRLCVSCRVDRHVRGKLRRASALTFTALYAFGTQRATKSLDRAVPAKHSPRMDIPIQRLCIDTGDPAKIASFWQSALGWRTFDEEDEVILEPPEGSPEDGIVPDLLFLKVPDAKRRGGATALGGGTARTACTWICRPTTPAAEIVRLTEPGTTVIAEHEHWTVLADRTGNVFCQSRH